MRSRAARTALALLVCVPLLARADGPRRERQLDLKAPLAWKVEDPATLLRFALQPWPPLKGDRGAKPDRLPGQRWGVIGRQLVPSGEGVYTRERAWLPLAIGLQLPDQVVRGRGRFTLKRRFADLSDVRPFALQLVAKEDTPTLVDGLTCRTFALRGALTDDSSKADRRTFAVAAARVGGQLYFHPGRQHVLAAEVDLRWVLTRPRDKRARPLRQRLRYRLDLDLVLPVKDPRLDQHVAKAIDAGVAWLKRKQAKTGNWSTDRTGPNPGGQAALGAQALLVSGVKRTDPHVGKAMKLALLEDPQNTYSVAVTLMAIEAAYAPSTAALEAMPEAQQAAAMAALPGKLTAVERDYAQRAATWLIETADRGRRWGYPLEKGTHTYDNSCSQYAALGLLAARRLGARVPPSIWSEIVDHWLREQDTSGPEVPVVRAGEPVRGTTASAPEQRARGWNYKRPDGGSGGSYGSMTCAGVASLAIARSELQRLGRLRDPKRRAEIDEAIRDGLAWLQVHLRVDRHPERGDNAWHFYYLYGLERAGVLADRKYLGDRDWYREGAAWLIANRQDTAPWARGDVNSTAFALLFLKKATRPLITLSR